MYLLDRNVVSELRRPNRAAAPVRAWADRTPDALSGRCAISLLELESGVRRIERRGAAQGGLLRRWLEDQVPTRFRERALPVDAEVGRPCAGLHVHDPRPDRDALLAGMRKFPVILNAICRDGRPWRPAHLA